VSKLIKVFKYNFLLDTVEVFRKIINNVNFNCHPELVPACRQAGQDLVNWHGFTIIPVPLHARRKRERGFNQSEIIAEIISEKLGLTINQNLRRVIYTAQQAKLSGDERRKNLQGAFVWSGGQAPEKVLLVDDVFTTGATMQECAKVLKNCGVKTVSCLVLARG
jgi:ComF family protein